MVRVKLPRLLTILSNTYSYYLVQEYEALITAQTAPTHTNTAHLRLTILSIYRLFAPIPNSNRQHDARTSRGTHRDTVPRQ